jgi:hypothetical protein
MLLTAWMDGPGSNWVGFGGLDHIKPLLGIPTAMEVFAVLPIGYPGDETKGSRQEAAKSALRSGLSRDVRIGEVVLFGSHD